MAVGASAPRGRSVLTNRLVNTAIARDASSPAYHPQGMRIVITGGTGFLGTGLVDRLRTTGHTVTVLARRPTREGEVEWSPHGSPAALDRALEGADAVINLAGASIAQRWTRAHKRELWESRVTLTRALVEALKRTTPAPSTLISGSAVGIYGN